MSYIGNTTQNVNYVPAVDYFNGDGSTVAFTLSRPVASVAAVQAVINNVPQNPGSAFTVSGNTITFTSAPPSGTANIYVYYTSPNMQVVQPGQGTVGPTQVDGNYALWNKSGSDVNYTAGNVLVGTTTASQRNTIKQSVDNAYAGMGLGVQKSNDDSTLVMGYRSDISPAGFFIGPSYNSTGSYYPLSFRTSDTVRMTIDSSGRVTTPYNPSFRAGMNTNTAVTGGAAIKWDGTTHNVGNCYSTSTGRFTAPVAGTYAFYTTYLIRGLSGGAGPQEGQMKVNGSILLSMGRNYYQNLYTGDSGYLAESGSFCVYLNANDYVEMQNNQSVTIHGDPNWSQFSGYLVG